MDGQELMAPSGKLMVPKDPTEQIAYATKAANALKQIVDQAKLSKKLGGDKEHLQFEAWQTIGQFYSATPKVIKVDPILDKDGDIVGYNARAVVVRDGTEIGAAEMSCRRDDEKNWANKPLFQVESMAQTRAQAKALRSVFSWVVVLAGYEATPVEEMDGVYQEKNHIKEKPPTQERLSEKDYISDAQQKRFFAIARSTGAGINEIKDWLMSQYDIEATKDIPRSLYDEICTRAKDELGDRSGE